MRYFSFCRTGILFLLTIVLLYGCATAPYTGRNQLLAYSRSEELQLGNDAWQQIKNQSKISTNEQQKAMVSRVANRLIQVADQDDFNWEFAVFDADDTANAFALPGGKIAVYSGLFHYISCDDDLAVVLGHEIAHAVARHSAEQMSQQIALELGGALVTAAIDNTETAQQVSTAYSLVSHYGLTLTYSRAMEYEADQIGLILMTRAGYDPEKAISFWQRFDSGSPGDRFTQYLSTHPRGADRVQAMQQALPGIQQKYQP